MTAIVYGVYLCGKLLLLFYRDGRIHRITEYFMSFFFAVEFGYTLHIVKSIFWIYTENTEKVGPKWPVFILKASRPTKYTVMAQLGKKR